MKKFQTMLLMMLVACMSMSVLSCGSDDKDDDKKEKVYYHLDTSDLKILNGNEETAQAFSSELDKVFSSLQGQDLTDALVIQRIQSVVDIYNNGVIFGNLVLMRGSTSDVKSMKTIKTFEMTLNPKYQENQ